MISDWRPPDWLVEWREQKAKIDPDSVERALEPFGVVRRSVSEVAKSLEPAVVYVFVSGTVADRTRTAKKITRHAGMVVSYADAFKESDSHDRWLRRSMAWSVIRADVSVAVMAGHPVVVDAVFSNRDDLREFALYCFLSGARGVVALCFTTKYEEELEEDGLTGVVWLV